MRTAMSTTGSMLLTIALGMIPDEQRRADARFSRDHRDERVPVPIARKIEEDAPHGARRPSDLDFRPEFHGK